MKVFLFLFLIHFTNISFSQDYKSFKINQGVYSFKLNSHQGGSSTFIEFDHSNNEFIRSVVKPQSALEIFDTRTGVLKYTIPTKTKTLGSFKKINQTTFWVHDATSRLYMIINKKGEILKRIKEPDFDKDIIYIISSDYAYAPIITYKDDLYVTGRIMFKNLKEIDYGLYKKTGIILKLNSNAKSSFVGQPATSSLTNFYGNMNNYSITTNKDYLIASPHFSDEIQVLNLKTNLVKKIILKTKYNSLIKPLSNLKDAHKFKNAERNEYFKRSYTNVGIVYDKYNKVYYRFIRYPFTNPGPMNCNIIVFNEDFKFLFETKIDPKTYNPSQFFVTDKGLAILNHKNYKENDTKIVFDVFSLIK